MFARAICKYHRLAGLMLLASAVLSGCSSEQAEVVPPVTPAEPEPISLAFACASSSHAATRMDDGVVQQNEAESYRTISGFHFIALKKDNGGNILSASNTEVDHPQIPRDHLPTRYYHFNYCDMPNGVNGCLVYAKATDEEKASAIATSAHNGKLNQVIPDYLTSVNQISYEPASIYADAELGADGIHADAWKLANALTAIANVSADGYVWCNYTLGPELKQLSSKFINNGYDLPGSAASVRKWIEALLDAVDKYHFGAGTTDEKLYLALVAKANEYLDSENENNILSLNYPQNINLPDGAAVLRWAEVEEEEGVKVKKFVPQLQTTTLDDINSISRFVYPPALYYCVNSGIWTSNNKVTFDQYKDRSKWAGNDDYSVQKLFSDGGTITSSTKTIAIESPMQYAVAKLVLKVKVDENADDTDLKYDSDNHCIAYKNGDNHFFRLTGVIIGGQRKVGYDFKPLNNSDVDVNFVYDSQVAANFYLNKTSTNTLSTLLLQSWDGEDLNLILEFEYKNNDDSEEAQVLDAFKCLNGYVYPGTRFYLVGEVKAADFKEGTGDTASRGRVFTQDYTTTIEATVSSLEKAYNVLPSILAKNLEIGVQTTPQWKAATPSDPIILE